MVSSRFIFSALVVLLQLSGCATRSREVPAEKPALSQDRPRPEEATRPLAAVVAPRSVRGVPLSVTTKVGRRVILEEVRAFTVESLGDGKPGQPVYKAEFYSTDERASIQVPLGDDNGFGFIMRLPRIEQGDTIEITMAAGLPFPILVGGKARSVIGGSWTFGSADSGNEVRPGVYFRSLESLYRKAGAWRIQFQNGGRALVERTFIVEAAGTRPAQGLPPSGNNPPRR